MSSWKYKKVNKRKVVKLLYFSNHSNGNVILCSFSSFLSSVVKQNLGSQYIKSNLRYANKLFQMHFSFILYFVFSNHHNSVSVGFKSMLSCAIISCAIKSVLDSGYLRVLNVLAWQVGVGVGENLLMFNVEAVSLLGTHWKILSEEGKVCWGLYHRCPRPI